MWVNSPPPAAIRCMPAAGAISGSSSGSKNASKPMWESKSDYEIFTLIAERLGMRDIFTDGKSEVDWIKAFFDISDLPKLISWEEFNKKGYCIINTKADYKSTPSLRWFAEGRDCDTPDTNNPQRGTDKAKDLGTYSGKIEFVSESLKAHFPDDEERPVSPRYIPSWEGHRSDLFKTYPLQLLSPHPRFSFHCHYDKHTDWLNDIPGHRIKKDGYAWWPARIHPVDADRAWYPPWRHRATIQRPRISAVHGRSHPARASRRHPQLCLVGQI